MRKIYREIARKNGVTVEKVKRDIQVAINEAYVNPNTAALVVPKKGTVPTPEEFIMYMACKVQSKEN